MARRGFRLKIPGLGSKLNLKSPNTWLWVGGAALAGLAILAYTGKKTGVGFIDTAAGQFEDTFEDYIGPFPDMPGPMAKKPVQTAPVVPSAPSRGMTFDDMVFSGAYATDAPTPYVDWWNNDISDDDRIIVA